MILPILLTTIIVLGFIIFYIFFLGPKLNPLNKAENFIAQNMVSDAIIEYKKILDNDPNNFIIHYKLSELFFQIEEVDQAVVHLEEILKIDKFNYEIEKISILKKLATSYMFRDEIDKAFQMFANILSVHPGDEDSLYHAAFICLGQEEFEYAQKYFELLIKKEKKSFEILFGAGIACYQNQQIQEAIHFLDEALGENSHSDIANLAMAFALRNKRDYKTAMNYLKPVVDNSKDLNAVFISKRLQGILLVQSKKAEEGANVLEDVLEYAKKMEMEDEISMLLYDLGFALLNAEKTNEASEYWDELYQLDRNYQKIQRLITILRKEMDFVGSKSESDYEESVVDHIDSWLDEAFPEDFIWRICGLKSKKEINLSAVVTLGKTTSKGKSGGKEKSSGSHDSGYLLDKYIEADVETFRIVSNRVLTKLKYKIDEILPTYRENDGVDFMAHSTKDDIKVLIWVRRWKGVQIGEIPLRNLAQAVNDYKAKKGLFITTSELTESGEASVKRLSKISVIYPEELGRLLKGFF